MTAKQYLQSYRRLEGNYKAIVEEYKAVETDMISIKSPSFGDRVQSSPKNDPIGEIVISLQNRKGVLSLKMFAFQAQMMTIRNQIMEMEDVDTDFYSILMLRYILYKDWKSICNSVNMSRAQANVVHGMALAKFTERYGESFLTN
jgi:hypothetical protein